MLRFLLIPLLTTVTLAGNTILPLRSQISLNGIWDFTPEGNPKSIINVPDFWDAQPAFSDVKKAVYERTVFIPIDPDWQDKKIQIEFDAVNFIANVYINNKLVGNHVGGYIPFSFDITPWVSPGKSFVLKVEVQGGSFSPIVDEKGSPQWPVGFKGQEQRWGIVFDVWMRAYGKVSIRDAFIQTSYQKKEISIDYTLQNDFSIPKTFQIIAQLFPANDTSKIEKEIRSASITLQPGETKIYTLREDWKEPHLWSPADPSLYYLKSQLFDINSNLPLDKESRRFGFREIWIANGKLQFNGHPITLLGTNLVQHSEFHATQRYHYVTKETWNTTIDRLFELNLRTVRFHMQPPPQFVLDMADERGLLVMDESTIYAREYVLNANKPLYLENCKKWIEPWVKGHRNHPCVIVWNAENEMGIGWLNWMNPAEIKSLGDAIRQYDNTRPVNYDGDADVGDNMVNYHYPETYLASVKGSIYSWADSVSTTKPTGVGEFITHYGVNGNANQWWMGTWVRGMRYVGFCDIRPYRHDWALLRTDNTPKIQNLINSLSPVALFDKEYDDLGIDPLMNENYPEVKTGDTIQHTLVLYNDEFEETNITIEVLLKSSQTYSVLYNYNGDRAEKQVIIAQTVGTYTVPLGHHIEIPLYFQVPPLSEGFADNFEVELIARKNGQVKFCESKKYELRASKSGNTYPINLRLGN